MNPTSLDVYASVNLRRTALLCVEHHVYVSLRRINRE